MKLLLRCGVQMCRRRGRCQVLQVKVQRHRGHAGEAVVCMIGCAEEQNAGEV